MDSKCSKNSRVLSPSRVNRRGLAIVYLGIALVTLTGICSLAVDYGRYELCKSELQRATDAAARAGAFQLWNSASAAQTAATSVVNANYVDATRIGSNSRVTQTIQFLLWTDSTHYTVLSSSNYSSANAIRVKLTYNVPLTFGKVIGFPTKTATRLSTALLVTHSENVFVSANGDIWLSGEPTGTQGSRTDPNWAGQQVNADHPWQHDYAGPVGGTMSSGERYSSPPQASIPIVPGSIIRISNVSGNANQEPIDALTGTADGNFGGSLAPITHDYEALGVSEHGIADVYMPHDSLAAVFLGNSLPDNSSAPPVLDFSTQAARDYLTLSPQVKQPFYAGLGQTSTSVQQSIVVPAGATRMFLGMMDGWEWSNNGGGYNATITSTQVMMVQ